MKLLERTKKAAKNFENDTEGIMLPILAGMVIIFVLLGTVNFSLLIMYRDRAAVRNALDAGVVSALAAHTREVHVELRYTETLVNKAPHQNISEIGGCCGYCRYRYCDYDRDGNETNCRTVTYCCRGEWSQCIYYSPGPCGGRWCQWENARSQPKNYIHLPIAQARATAESYFRENMQMNIADYAINSFRFDVRYDDRRVYDVHKNRPRMAPHFPTLIQGLVMVPASCTNRGCGGGSNRVNQENVHRARITNIVVNAHEERGSWWNTAQWGFIGADTGSWGGATGFTNNVTETIPNVLFPRWVEVTATANVRMRVPFGTVVGRDTYTATFTITAFKELVRAIP